MKPAGSAPEQHRAPGLFAWFGMPVPFRERMTMIREAGFGAVSLWWEDDDPRLRRLRDYTPEAARAAGLEIDHIHAPFRDCNTLWSGDRNTRLEAVARHTGWLDDCVRHGVGVLVMHAVSGEGAGLREADGVDSFRRIADAAGARGVNVAVENTRSRSHLDAILDTVGGQALGLCYDSSHDWLYGRPPGALLQDWGDRLIATHFSDTDGRRDQHWLPGEGVVDFNTVAGAFAGNRHGVRLLLEVTPRNRETDARAFLAEAYAAWNRLAFLIGCNLYKSDYSPERR